MVEGNIKDSILEWMSFISKKKSILYSNIFTYIRIKKIAKIFKICNRNNIILAFLLFCSLESNYYTMESHESIWLLGKSQIQLATQRYWMAGRWFRCYRWAFCSSHLQLPPFFMLNAFKFHYIYLYIYTHTHIFFLPSNTVISHACNLSWCHILKYF